MRGLPARDHPARRRPHVPERRVAARPDRADMVKPGAVRIATASARAYRRSSEQRASRRSSRKPSRAAAPPGVARQPTTSSYGCKAVDSRAPSRLWRHRSRARRRAHLWRARRWPRDPRGPRPPQVCRTMVEHKMDVVMSTAPHRGHMRARRFEGTLPRCRRSPRSDASTWGALMLVLQIATARYRRRVRPHRHRHRAHLQVLGRRQLRAGRYAMLGATPPTSSRGRGCRHSSRRWVPS
jgi:hypothetical protein